MTTTTPNTHERSRVCTRIIEALDDIDLKYDSHQSGHEHVSPSKCRGYIWKLTKGEPLNSLHARTLQHVLNMLHGVLYR